MSVYIKGMEMPKSNNNLEQVEQILISSSGLVEWVDDNNTLLAEYEAVELPSHGRLVDADALIEECMKEDGFIAEMLFRKVSNAPTIIPAERKDGAG